MHSHTRNRPTRKPTGGKTYPLAAVALVSAAATTIRRTMGPRRRRCGSRRRARDRCGRDRDAHRPNEGTPTDATPRSAGRRPPGSSAPSRTGALRASGSMTSARTPSRRRCGSMGVRWSRTWSRCGSARSVDPLDLCRATLRPLLRTGRPRATIGPVGGPLSRASSCSQLATPAARVVMPFDLRGYRSCPIRSLENTEIWSRPA